MKQARLFAISKPDRDADEHAVERIWFKKLQHARTAYRREIAKLKSLPVQLVGASDASSEIDAVRQSASQALIEYQRLLRLFTDLVSDRKIPEEDWQESDRAKKH